MKIWKQLLLSLLVLVAAFLLWIALVPGSTGVLTALGLGGPVAMVEARLATPAAQTTAAQTTGGQTSGGQASAGQASGGKGADAAASKGGTAPAGSAAAGGQAGQGGGQSGGRSGFSRGPSVVVVHPATSAILNDRVTAIGTGLALQSAALAPQAAGTLTTLSVHSGDAVTAGEVVAKLDADTQQIAYDKAKLAAEDAQKTLAHDQALVASGAMPTSQLQAVELAAAMADLSLRSAKNDLDDRQVVAPFAGKLGLVSVNPGIAVTPQTVIATLEDTSSLTLRFAMPERLVGTVKLGALADLVPVARPDLALQAKITAVDAQVDAASGTFQVEALLPNPDGTLVSGMTFVVTLHFPGDTFVAVNPLAIQWGSQGAYVWRLTADSKVEQVSVRIVQRNTDAVLVAGKIAEGDNIVTEGLDGLRAGATVQVAGAGGQAQSGQSSSGPAQTAQAGEAQAATAPQTDPPAKSATDPAKGAADKTKGQTQSGTSAPSN